MKRGLTLFGRVVGSLSDGPGAGGGGCGSGAGGGVGPHAPLKPPQKYGLVSEKAVLTAPYSFMFRSNTSLDLPLNWATENCSPEGPFMKV